MAAPSPGMPEPIRSVPEPASVPARAQPRPRADLNMPAWRAGAPTLPPALASGPDIFGLLRALRRRWFIALGLGLVCAIGAAAAVYFLMVPKYTAFSQIHIDAVQPTVFRNPNGESGREFGIYLGTQATRIKSRFVLNEALKRDDVKSLPIVQQQPDPIVWLEEELKVEVKDGSEFVTISMTGADPASLVAIVHAVTDAYLYEVSEEEPRLKSKRLSELENILTGAENKLSQKKDLFRRRAKELGTPDAPAIAQKQVGLLTNLSELRADHARVSGELAQADVRLKTHQAQEKLLTEPDIPETLINEAAEKDPYVTQLMQDRSFYQKMKRHYEEQATNPQIEEGWRKAVAGVTRVNKEVEARLADVRKGVMKRIRAQGKLEYDIGLKRLQTEVKLLKDRESGLRAKAEAMAADAEKIGTNSTELELLRREIDSQNSLADDIRKAKDLLGVEVRAPSRVRLAQDAGLQKKDIKRMMMMLVAAPAGVFGLIVLVVAYLEFRRRRIHTADEVATGLGVRVVGSVPSLTAGQRRALDDGEAAADDYGLLESIDSIRTQLLRDASVQETRVVMVTSAVSGEGKTTLASHLATSLARAGRKTLLVDCDLRRPAAHQLFELPLQPGLSEVLMDEVHVAEATRSTTVAGLWVMPAGQYDREVMHALARDGVEEVFGKLKAEYDFIVVDSHPLLPANDSVLIAQHVDAVLLSLLRDVSQAPRVYAACQRLGTLGIRVLGAVVNGMNQEDYGGGYSYAAPAKSA